MEKINQSSNKPSLLPDQLNGVEDSANSKSLLVENLQAPKAELINQGDSFDKLNINPYLSQISKASESFGADLPKKSISSSEIRCKQMFQIDILDPEDEEKLNNALWLRNLVVLQGINVLTAAYERMEILETNGILGFGEHMIRIYGGLQSPIIDKKSLKIVLENNPTVIITNLDGNLVGVYFYITQLNSDNTQSKQEKIIFGEDHNALSFIKEKIIPHNQNQKQNMNLAIDALKRHNLAYFATICTAPGSRGKNIGTVLNYLTYKKAKKNLNKKRNPSVAIDNSGYVIQRYFSIGGVFIKNNDGFVPFHIFQPPIGNRLAAGLNKNTFSHLGTFSEFRSIFELTNVNTDKEYIEHLAKRYLGIPNDQIGNYYFRIDNLYVLIDINNAIKHCEIKIEKYGLKKRFKGLDQM